MPAILRVLYALFFVIAFSTPVLAGEVSTQISTQGAVSGFAVFLAWLPLLLMISVYLFVSRKSYKQKNEALDILKKAVALQEVSVRHQQEQTKLLQQTLENLKK
jgi:uncharacterized membrane protein (DUF485 family)